MVAFGTASANLTLTCRGDLAGCASHGCGRRPVVASRQLLLCFVSEPFLMPIRFHAFATLMLRNFRFSSFLERAHSISKLASSDSTIRYAAMQPQFSHCWVTSSL